MLISSQHIVFLVLALHSAAGQIGLSCDDAKASYATGVCCEESTPKNKPISAISTSMQTALMNTKPLTSLFTDAEIAQMDLTGVTIDIEAAVYAYEHFSGKLTSGETTGFSWLLLDNLKHLTNVEFKFVADTGSYGSYNFTEPTIDASFPWWAKSDTNDRTSHCLEFSWYQGGRYMVYTSDAATAATVETCMTKDLTTSQDTSILQCLYDKGLILVNPADWYDTNTWKTIGGGTRLRELRGCSATRLLWRECRSW